MDSAHSGDLVPVAAKDIGKIDGWKALKWYCLGCPVHVIPVACDPDETFRRIPHFSLNKSGRDKHAEDCDVAGLNLLIEKARKKAIQSNDILLGHLPYSVLFRDSVTTLDDPEVKPGNPGDNGYSAGSEGGKPTRFHRPSRSSIESICRAHAAMKHSELRETQSLNVEGCLGSNYRDTFYQLQDIPGGDPPNLHSCIFYGELRFRAKPDYGNPEKLILMLNRWVRSEEHGDQPYRLIIRWEGWRDQLRTLFVQEVETRRQATNRRYDAPGRDRSIPFRADIIIYFLGQQVDGSPTDFEISDCRKVAIVVEPNGIYNDYPNHSFLRRVPRPAKPSQPRRAEPPLWVTPDTDTLVRPPEPNRAAPPVVPRPPAVTREHAPATPFREINPMVTYASRTTNHVDKTPFARPTYYPPRPKPRPGFIEAAKEWILSLFD